MQFCCKYHLHFFFVAKMYLHILARPDLNGKLCFMVVPQVMIACKRKKKVMVKIREQQEEIFKFKNEIISL